MKIFLVRHGQSEANAYRDNLNPDTKLTELGKSQAKETAKTLKSLLKYDHKKIDVWSSPLRRAKETASAYSKIFKIMDCAKEFRLVKHRGWDFSWENFNKRIDTLMSDILFWMTNNEDKCLIIFLSSTNNIMFIRKDDNWKTKIIYTI